MIPPVITRAIKKKNVVRRIYCRAFAPVTFIWLFDRVLNVVRAADACF
jgi:hypothetical protein